MNCPFKPSSVTTKAFCSLKDWKVCICTFYYSIWGCGYHCRYWSCDNSLDRECTGLTWGMSPVKSDPRVDPHQWHLARQFRDTWPGIQETPGQATPGLATETPGQAIQRYLARQPRDTWPGDTWLGNWDTWPGNTWLGNWDTWPGNSDTCQATDLLCKAVGFGKKVSQLVAYAGFDHMMHKLIMLFLMLCLWFSDLLPWNPLCFEFDEFLSTR